MTSYANVAVVIPALDEQDTIAEVVDSLRTQGVPRVVVADNGSADATARRAHDAGAVVVQERRRGYGFACAAGTQRAISDGATVIAYIDADQSSDAAEIGRVLDPILAGSADLVLGSRVLGTIEPGAMPVHQRLGNRTTASAMSRLYRTPITDLGPFRAIDTGLLGRLEMSHMTFGWPAEMMVKAIRSQARVIEVPVTWRTRRAGDSKVGGSVKGSVLAGWHILRVTFAHVRWRPSAS